MTYMFMKYRLMAPGPTPVPEVVQNEMAAPIWHHRTPAFEAVMVQVQEGLRWLYQTKNDVIVLASSGSGAMEATIVNVCARGDAVLVIVGGKFGERFAKIARAHGLDTDVVAVEWGNAVDPALVQKRLAQKAYRAVCVQATETSTGLSHPVKELADIVKKHAETVLIVDAITALGVEDLPIDTWGLDVVIGGSQKALMLPPGLATLSVSDKAWSAIEKSDTPKFYFDLKQERKALKNNTTAWTPAVSLFMGLKKVLELMQKEGLQNIFRRHALLAQSIRDAAAAINLKLLSPESPSNSVTAIHAPTGIDSGKIVSGLRDKFNMTIAGGQDHLKGKIFRIGHMGYYDLFDMIAVWSAVEKQLHNLGYQFDVGKGTAEIIKKLP